MKTPGGETGRSGDHDEDKNSRGKPGDQRPTGDRKPMVKLTEVWERTSRNGNKYFSGYLGASQLLIFEEGEKPHPTRPGETVHVWKVLVQERGNG